MWKINGRLNLLTGFCHRWQTHLPSCILKMSLWCHCEWTQSTWGFLRNLSSSMSHWGPFGVTLIACLVLEVFHCFSIYGWWFSVQFTAQRSPTALEIPLPTFPDIVSSFKYYIFLQLFRSGQNMMLIFGYFSPLHVVSKVLLNWFLNSTNWADIRSGSG